MSNFVIVNVLGEEYFNDCHIKGSINIPFSELEDRATELDKNKKIILYCANYTCSASRKAWHMLRDKGFTDVLAYEGGIAEWYQMGFPVEGPASKEYLTQPSMRPEQQEDLMVKEITAVQLQGMMG